jgi:hypothetical protein
MLVLEKGKTGRGARGSNKEFDKKQERDKNSIRCFVK